MSINKMTPPQVTEAASHTATLADLIDIPAIQNVCDSFFQFTGIPLGIIDIRGNVLIASGWKDICTKFHRKNPETCARCLESDTVLASQLKAGQQFNLYKCKNGLIDVASPIIIDDVHLGNVFIGQFLSEQPDTEFFENQADRFGFDKKEYLTSLKDIPVLPQDVIKKAIKFLTDLTTTICVSGLDKLRLRELNRDLEGQVQARTAALIEEKTFSESLINSLPGVMYVIDRRGKYINWNRNMEMVTGFSREEISKMETLDLISSEHKERAFKVLANAFEEGQITVESNLATATGESIPFLFTGFIFSQHGEDYLIGVGIDISERVRAENEKSRLIEQLQSTLKQVKQLSGLLPICSSCKKIRDDKGYWNQIESYIHDHSDAEFSHGLCPDCAEQMYGDQNWYINKRKKK